MSAIAASAPVAPAVALTIEIDATARTSGLLQTPPDARAGFVFAHGAGAGMQHRFMQQVADGLAQRGIAVLRYQFAYMERGSKRTDPPALAQAAVRAAVAHAGDAWPALPLFAGGKSFGARMTSQAEAARPLPGVRGLAFIGFPLHPAGRPSTERARHLSAVGKPMLFVQGTRDKLAEPDLLMPVIAQLGERTRLHLIDAADHGFEVLVRSGRTADEVLAELLDATVTWIDAVCDDTPGRSRPPG